MSCLTHWLQGGSMWIQNQDLGSWLNSEKGATKKKPFPLLSEKSDKQNINKEVLDVPKIIQATC